MLKDRKMQFRYIHDLSELTIQVLRAFYLSIFPILHIDFFGSLRHSFHLSPTPPEETSSMLNAIFCYCSTWWFRRLACLSAFDFSPARRVPVIISLLLSLLCHLPPFQVSVLARPCSHGQTAAETKRYHLRNRFVKHQTRKNMVRNNE